MMIMIAYHAHAAQASTCLQFGGHFAAKRRDAARGVADFWAWCAKVGDSVSDSVGIKINESPQSLLLGWLLWEKSYFSYCSEVTLPKQSMVYILTVFASLCTIGCKTVKKEATHVFVSKRGSQTFLSIFSQKPKDKVLDLPLAYHVSAPRTSITLRSSSNSNPDPLLHGRRML